MRILVTGSRLFGCHATVRIALAKAVEGQPGTHTLVHGGASGADRIAAGLAAKQGWAIEEYPADWGAIATPAATTVAAGGTATTAAAGARPPAASATRP